VPPTEPTLAELIQKAQELLEELLELLERQTRAKALRNLQKDHPQAKTVEGYGVLTATNPTDAQIDAWTEQECLDFGEACKARSEEL